MGVCYSLCCCQCCSSKMPVHGPLTVSMPRGAGVGRLDHYSLEVSVRQDVIDLLTQDFLGGGGTAQHPLLDWVFGDHLNEEQKESFANHLASLMWEETVDFCGGIVLGVRNQDGSLGGAAFLVPVEPSDRRAIGSAAQRCLLKYRFWMYRWSQLGKARVGLQARARCFHEIRHEHLSQPMKDHSDYESVLSLRLLAGSSEASKQFLLRTVCYYADQRNYTTVCHAIRQETVELFESIGFDFNKHVQASAEDPEQSKPLQITDMYRKCQWPPMMLEF